MSFEYFYLLNKEEVEIIKEPKSHSPVYARGLPPWAFCSTGDCDGGEAGNKHGQGDDHTADVALPQVALCAPHAESGRGKKGAEQMAPLGEGLQIG